MLALEAALWAVASTDDFEAAILAAVNLGDDADTTAAIAGQLAGALYGVEGIPARWRERILMREQILDFADRLEASRYPRRGDPHRPHLAARHRDPPRRPPMLEDVFEGELTAQDWDNCLGGIHVLAYEGDELVGHASVIQRRLVHAGRALRAGYVEGVGVRADQRGAASRAR